MRLLVADDDASIRGLIEALLIYRGYQVTTAESGDQAYEIFERQKDDLDGCVLDVVMPGRTGPEAFIAMYHLKPIPALFVTGGVPPSMVDILDECEKEYGCMSLRKPFTHSDFYNRVEKLFGPPPCPP